MVVIASTLLLDEDKYVREQAALLIGTFVSHQRARDRIEETCPLLKLEDEELKVREATAWTFYQLSLTRNGCDIIVDTESAISIVNSFMNFADPKKLREQSGKYLIYLLECMANTTQYDIGIEPLLGKGAVTSLNYILKDEEQIQKLGPFKNRIQQLSLKVVGNMALHSEGKEEAISEKVILYAWKFLNSEDMMTVFNASHVLMCCTIHLDGKKQATDCEDANGNPIIIQKLVEKLYLKDDDIRENIKTTLANISELPTGSLKITHELSDKYDLIDEVFEARGIKTLCEMLPKLEQYDNPLSIDVKDEKYAKYIQYVHTINKIFQKYKLDAVEVAITQTINFIEKVFPYINPNLHPSKDDTYKPMMEGIKLICEEDEYSSLLLKRLLNKYGNETPVNLSKYLLENHKELIEIINKTEEDE